MCDRKAEHDGPLSLVVLISGRGSNLGAILQAIDAGELPVAVSAVISSSAAAPGLAHARSRHIDTLALDAADYPQRDDYDRALRGLIERFNPDLVVLAGFMRILTPGFVRHFRGRIINIHPSLLPDFRGLRTHQRALQAGAREHGASVHFVTEELDGGPVIAQVRVPVLPDDDAASLAARVLREEHRLYPQTLRWLAEGRVCWDGDQVLFDGRPLGEPQQLQSAGAEP